MEGIKGAQSMLDRERREVRVMLETRDPKFLFISFVRNDLKLFFFLFSFPSSPSLSPRIG